MPSATLSFQPDLDLTRDALASSTLSHGLLVLGDRWIVSILSGAFTGVTRFDDWQARLGIPRSTLADRLRTLVDLGLMRQRVYQERPLRHAYHLTREGLKLYGHVLMIWVWEKRWGTRRADLPVKLVHEHAGCGAAFAPKLACGACHGKVGIADLRFSLEVNPRLLAHATTSSVRTARLAPEDGTGMGLGLRVDRWALLIIAAVTLGCHYFHELGHVLGISSSVLSRRLAGMVESGLLITQPDLNDGRRAVYRLTPASHDLFPYLVCFSNWANGYLGEPSSIRPVHKGCGAPFRPEVVCGACGEVLLPWEVRFEGPGASASTPATAAAKAKVKATAGTMKKVVPAKVSAHDAKKEPRRGATRRHAH